jgi:hypothetical protein
VAIKPGFGATAPGAQNVSAAAAAGPCC